MPLSVSQQFLFKLKKTQPINFKPYFKNVNKIFNHLTRFSETNYYIPRENILYGFKTLSYFGNKVWEEIPSNLKGQSYLGAFKTGTRVVLLKKQSDKSQTYFLFIFYKLRKIFVICKFKIYFLAD